MRIMLRITGGLIVTTWVVTCCNGIDESQVTVGVTVNAEVIGVLRSALMT